MKITEVICQLLRVPSVQKKTASSQDAVIVRVRTDTGLEGIGEADASLVRPGAPLEVRLDGRTVSGRVVAVLASVDAATRRVPLEAEIKNDSGQPLFGGAYVRAVVSGLRPVPVLRLPASALRPGSQNEVLVADGKLQKLRHIVFARAADGALLVRGGLEPNERVLAAPTAEAADGDPLAAAAQ